MTQTVLWVLFGVCCAIEVVFTPWYLKALWPVKCFKSLCLKMVCSSMFFSIGLLSVFISGNKSSYAITIMIALALGWIGDYFLHAKPTNAYCITGFVSFMLGHVVYIVAYCRALPALFEGYKFISLPEVLIGAGIFAAAVIVAIAMKVKFSPSILKYFTILYTMILITMFLKAASLGIKTYLSGGSVIAALVLVVGSLFFFLSDATLGLILFCGQKKNYPLKIFNIVTYFLGQVMLASSILFISA